MIFCVSATASHHEVQLLGPGGGRLLFERQVVVRRRAHEAVQDSDADTSRQNAGRHGQTQRIPHHVNLPINQDHVHTQQQLWTSGNGSMYSEEMFSYSFIMLYSYKKPCMNHYSSSFLYQWF